MSIAIRKNHPIKPIEKRRVGDPKYPFARMVAGDSFAMPLSDFASVDRPQPTFEYARNLIRSAANAYRSRSKSPLWFRYGLEDDGKSIAVEAYLKG